MGMSDQYDDGRYDSRPGVIVSPGWPFNNLDCLLTPIRGGMKYPKPKGTPMERQTKAQIAHELRLNAELQDQLRKRRIELEKDMKTAIPVEPHTFTMFSVDVKFSMRGKSYQFLILRAGTKYFTTGSTDKSAVFESWEALVNWLEGPDVYAHSDLEILQSAGKVVSFDTGAIEKIIGSEPPF